MSAHTSAVSEATALTCENNQFETGSAYLFALAEAFASDTILIAESMAATTVECTSEGDAFGCAYSSATASKIATAVADAHSKAVASVTTACSHCLKANVSTKLEASIFQQIVLKVLSKAYSSVCVAGDDHRAAFEKCTASVIAEQFASAWAQAFLDTDCQTFADGSVSAGASAGVSITLQNKCSNL